MRDKGLATAVATLLAAFATAHLMQFGLSAGRAITGEAQGTPIGIATLVAWRAGAAPAELPPTPSPAHDPRVPAFRLPGARTTPPDAPVAAVPAASLENGFGLSCARTLRLSPLPDAFVTARVEAPCDPGVRIELRHAGLRFAIATDADGRAEADIPALMTHAGVEAAFADGTVLSARASIPEAARMERVVLVADGWAGLTLHAGQPGPRGAAQVPPDPERAIFRLGDPAVGAPLLAQVHSTLTGRFGPLGAADLRVEAALSPANCARDVTAEVIRSSGGVPSPTHLRLSLPDCDADGGVLIVDLPSPGLRVARN